MIEFTTSENTLNCVFQGRLGADNADTLSNKITKEINSQDNDDLKVTFDLQNVDYIASSFIRICVTTAKQLDEGNFSIINTNPMIKKVFKIAGLDEILNVS